MTNWIGERIEYKGHILEVVEEKTCKGCFFDNGSMMCKAPDDFPDCRPLVEGFDMDLSLIFKEVGKGGEE